MDSSGNLARCVEARDRLSAGANDGRVDVNLQPTHAVMDHRRDDGDIERLGGHLGPVDNVVVELLAAPCWAAGLVPGLAAGVRWEWATFRILLCVLRSFEVLLMLIDERLHR